MTIPVEGSLALLAGLATDASPCVLPVLPILLGVTVERPDRRRPLLIICGFIVSFCGFALALGAASAAAQVAQESLRNAALALLAISGLVRIWPQPYDWLAARAGAAFARLRPARPAQRPAAGGAFALGLSLGAVWTPCAGPVLASILALIVQARDPARSVMLVFLYALGAALPMLALIYGGNAATQRVRSLARHTATMQRVFGVLVLASAAAIYFQYDTVLIAQLPFPSLKGL
jgi:cytochrome c biogenesis protein CcdA